MTTNMQRFIEKNQKVGIVQGERLTPEGKPVLTEFDLSTTDRICYTFKDGESITLTVGDILSSPEFQPVWYM